MKIAATVGALALAITLVLTGCTANDALTANVHDSYTSADGSVTTLKAQDRGAAIDFSGPSDTGEKISSSSHLGQVVVVNFWYSTCAPCRTEAPLLEKSYQKLQASKVYFVGVNTFDQPDTSRSFAASYGITYPSIVDVDSGAVRLSFAGKMSPTNTPTTIVLDKQGRIAARVLGELDSSSILNQLVNDLLAEGSE